MKMSQKMKTTLKMKVSQMWRRPKNEDGTENEHFLKKEEAAKNQDDLKQKRWTRKLEVNKKNQQKQIIQHHTGPGR